MLLKPAEEFFRCGAGQAPLCDGMMRGPLKGALRRWSPLEFFPSKIQKAHLTGCATLSALEVAAWKDTRVDKHCTGRNPTQSSDDPG